MPELPEVETTRRGISPHILERKVTEVVIRNDQLRWPIPVELESLLPGKNLLKVSRRAKYLLLEFANGTLLMHLGMSGSLRIVEAELEPEKHDHLDIVFASGQALRLTDPRRFGAALWQPLGETHSLLQSLGPEPLSDEFDGQTLTSAAKGRKIAVKQLVMDNKVVVGVGNIYANEALFAAGIDPRRAAGRISAERYNELAAQIKKILAAAITQGGTTLKDFVGGDGKPGYFAQSLQVYGQRGELCGQCGTGIKEIRQGQRASFYCPRCQR